MMNFDFSKVLRRFKQKWTKELEASAIERICREEGVEWRRRVLDPVRTMQIFFMQVHHGNTACSHLPHLSRLRFSASAYCQARMRLPLAVFEKLLVRTSAGIEREESCEPLVFANRSVAGAPGDAFLSVEDTVLWASIFFRLHRYPWRRPEDVPASL